MTQPSPVPTGATGATAADVNHHPLTPLVYLERTLRVFPDREEVLYGGRRLTWRDFGDLVGRLAAALQRSGVERGDRVAVLLPNTP